MSVLRSLMRKGKELLPRISFSHRLGSAQLVKVKRVMVLMILMWTFSGSWSIRADEEVRQLNRLKDFWGRNETRAKSLWLCYQHVAEQHCGISGNPKQTNIKLKFYSSKNLGLHWRSHVNYKHICKLFRMDFFWLNWTKNVIKHLNL